MSNKLNWFFAALLTTGATTASADSVGVTIGGEITKASGSGCSVTTGALNFSFRGDSEDWAKYEDDGEFRFIQPDTADISIDCSTAGKSTTISFSTNDVDADSQNPIAGCGAEKCTSYPVVFQPDPASCLSQESPNPCGENLAEGRVTLRLLETGSGCGNDSDNKPICNVAPGLFSDASITAAAVAGISANFSGTLIARGQPRGKLSVSPRTQGPQLYVIYGGDS
jgi:hypothetical protein